MSNVFKYNTEHSYESNYSVWRDMNDKEYRDIGEKPYSKQESRRVFNENYGNYSVRERIQGLSFSLGKRNKRGTKR